MSKKKINKVKIEQYYISLYKKAQTSRKKKNIDIIYNILLDLYESSATNFSISNIGKLSKKNGGPITQTIRNKQGIDYQNLINFFKDNITVITLERGEEVEHLSEYIDDPALKAHINIIMAENKSLRSELNILKNNMSKNFQLNYGSSNELPMNSNDLLSTETDAIKRFIMDIEEGRNPLNLTEIGSLKDENNELIANVGFFDALKRII